MAKADALSQRSDHDQGNEHNKDITLLKPELFRVQIFDFSGQEHTLVKQIKKLSVEPEIINTVENEEEGWCEEGGLYLFKDRVYVPESVMRERILSQYYETALAGQPGQLKMQDLIERNFYWKTIKQDVAKYVSGCETCQRTKVDHGKKAAPLYPNSIPEGPWETISMDLIGPLPESQGYDSILNVVDRFSKEMVAIPCHTTLTAEGCARLLMERIFLLRGFPKKIITDRGPQFVSKFMTNLYGLLGIKGNPSTAYHPQTDGQTERLNQELEQYL